MDQLSEEDEGLIFFDGGTFSRGPHWLVDPPAEVLEDSKTDKETAEQVTTWHETSLQIIYTCRNDKSST